ncbi:dynamin-1-like protein [Paramacrobiotus metropolitanus]|uniref:dynamin-1-like protein n=1 Tax=Paramacrobiotus metropolitanus TaxID=2943436 RepID=UPI002445ED95|nr:dynamin-1-like protein [Paramacrobiotus metropolitanus]
MENFAELFNQLQTVINVVGQNINFPQIVVVGSQSDGKSSVLESIVKRGFLPRGTGVVTRTPVILQLNNTQSSSPSAEGLEEHAEVSYPDLDMPNLQSKGEVITDFSQVAGKILQATERLAGKQKNIVDKPITVKLHSPYVPDLTLVDLPGLVENRSGDQPDNIKEQVEQLVKSYVRNPNAIILAVHPATSDLANSKSLNIAREVDPNGSRTICVITKLDISDKADDKTDLLTGVEIANHHSKVLRTIAVISRSQADLNNKGWSMAAQLSKEERWFKEHYPRLADQHGSQRLSEFLSAVFRDHIRKCLPALKAAVNEMVSDSQMQLSALGEDVHSKLMNSEASRNPLIPNPGHVLVVSVIDQFVNYFKGAIQGDVDQGNTEVKGGSRIEELFNVTYWDALTGIVPLTGTSDLQVWTQIRNAWGTERQMFLNIKAFRILVQHEMARMEFESIRCVKLAYQEMLSIRNSAGQHIGYVKEQFPKLFDRIVDIVSQLMEIHLEEAKKMVSHAVKMQLDYLNVKHPDFEKPEKEAMKRFNEIVAQVEDSMNNDGSTNVHLGTPVPVRIAPIPPARQMPKPPSNGVVVNIGGQVSASGAPYPHIANGINGSWEGDTPTELEPVHSKSRSLTKREKLECDITAQLVREYFEVIRRIVRDSVPKVIVRFLVNAVRDEVLKELMTRIASSPQVYAPLLAESEVMATKRKNYSQRLDVFRNAAEIIKVLEAS